MANGALVNKLRIGPGLRIGLLNPPKGYLDELGPLPQDVALNVDPDGACDFVHDTAELEALLPAALRALKEGGLFWISYR